MSKRSPKRDPLLLELVAAIGAGNIEIGPIHDDETFVHGICGHDGRVRINPAPDVVETVIHEAIHRMRPAWSETTVRRRTTQIFSSLSDAETDKIYELVLAVSATKTHPERLK